ncbi:N-acetylmuramoyl-L-alanine amidase [Caldanaerovirga acetigignens]|uniref:N-acetylmuramoyl-L-alanine amidase n=1 Tax=Caldanaerovirga acetigignens TaxID=447595 RepID=A0A1M7HE95_9FIRM|nr:N-acetylmuramoyl-L-alanine amidase family protein [Caldanaerovirga acetigignens]SHM26779.1 N-acetylmuramoyl-L-alanine amidase [Caldanaerovirga acetigignens]
MIKKVTFAVLLVLILESSICVAQPASTIEIYINNQKVISDVPPVIYKDRTLVPIRVISEYFGATVLWDDKEKTVKVYLEGRQVILKINDTKALLDQQTVVLDVPAMIIDNRTMVPLRFVGEALMAEVSWNEKLRRVDVKKQIPQIVDFSYTTVNNIPALLIKGNTPLEYQVAGYDSERVAVDVKAQLKASKNVINVEDSVLKRVVVSELNDGSGLTRFVLEMEKGASFYIIKPDQNSIAITITNVLSSVELEEDGTLVARLKTVIPATYNCFTLGSPEKGDYRLVVDITNARLSASLPVVFDNDYIKGLRASQFTVNPYVVRVVFDLKGDLNYRVFQNGDEISVVFSSRKIPSRGDEDGSLKNKIIVIDPGHGGSDPGAVYAGVYEKDLNLDIAMRLKKLLEESGARVLMTRESDIYVSLYTRADIANQVGAHLFVSIHNNSSTNTSTSGTMTLYYPSPEKKEFAQILHKAVVETLGLPDLGLSERPNLVVTRETKMPSALVEVAFMSNARDLELLKTDEFKQKAAEGIYKGILRYFSAI